MKTCVDLWLYLAELFLEWEIFQTKVVEKIKTHILSFITFFRKPYRLYNNVEKYCTAEEVTHDNINTGHAICMWIIKAPDKHTHTHTHTHTHRQNM